jgi:hypothetical protein
MDLLVLRGDLCSQSLPAAALRAYGEHLQHLFHHTVVVATRPTGKESSFPHPVVSEEEARSLAARASFALVVSFGPPTEHACYPGAANVGMTFWEADRLPASSTDQGQWPARANVLHALWVCSRHTRRTLEQGGLTVPVRVVPWPLEDGQARRGEVPASDSCPREPLFALDRWPPGGRLLARSLRFRANPFPGSGWLLDRLRPGAIRRFLGSLRQRTASLFNGRPTLVCLAPDVPRSCLLMLLSEWLEFKRLPQAGPWSLILRIPTALGQNDLAELVLRFWEHVQALKRQLRVGHSGVSLWPAGPGADGQDFLLSRADGLLDLSLGHRVGLAVARCLALGKPVVLPRHTAVADYLPADYPYTVATRSAILRFVGPANEDYDPATTWEVPEPFALTAALRRFTASTSAERREAARAARACVLQWCGVEHVRRLLAAEVDSLRRLVQRRAA